MVNVSHPVTLIPGDGIGPEVADATVRAVNATGVSIDWQRADLNAEHHRQIRPGAAAARASSRWSARTSASKARSRRRSAADFRASTWPCASSSICTPTSARCVRCRASRRASTTSPIDMVIFRENTEDLYSGLEHEVVKDVVTSLKVITRTASMRIAEYAFDFAEQARPQEGHGDPQGQHHEAGRRAVPALLPRSGRSAIPRSNTTS